MQAEVAQFGIRVLEIMPGPIETDMLLASDKPAGRDRARAVPRAGRAAVGGPPGHPRPCTRRRAEAARRIVDAILDDDAPLRVGCDDLSEGMLAGWRNAASDEAWMRPLLASFTA